MKAELIQALTNNFEGHVNKTADGLEFWLARDLQHLLGYSKWENFLNVINKAKTSCEVSGHDCQDHFPDIRKMVDIGSDAKKEVDDYMLTRYACYLIAQNGDSSKDPIADFMPTILLKAKDFATEITIHNARNANMRSENQISTEHVTNNKAVRETLISRGIVPERLPASEDVKKVARKIESDKKKDVRAIKKVKDKE